MAGETGKAIELEGFVTALNVLRVLTHDLSAVCAALERRIAETPALFRGAALVVDLTALDAPATAEAADPASQADAAHRPFALAELVAWLKARELVPVAASTLGERRRREAAAAGLGSIDVPARAQRSAPRKPRATAQEVRAALAGSETGAATEEPDSNVEAAPLALTLTQPLRAGRIVYAEGRDAIALAAINAGAELIADGNIHVYAPLRGRALAGARGNEQARIFCHKLEADLVSIAGVYLSADLLPEDKLGKPVQIYLRNGELVVVDLVPR